LFSSKAPPTSHAVRAMVATWAKPISPERSACIVAGMSPSLAPTANALITVCEFM